MNSGPKKLIGVIAFFLVTFLGMRLTAAFFSDSGQSTTNTFQAAAQFPTATPTPSPTNSPTTTPIPTPSNIANHVVISEVQIKGSGSHAADQDFIELYNPTSSSFDLNGHRLVKRDSNDSSDQDIKVWEESTVIPAHGFYLWANSEHSFASSIGANASTNKNIASNNSIALRNGPKNTGTIIDALSWSNNTNALQEGTSFSPTPQDNQSMERKALSTSTASSMSIGGSDEFKGNGYDTNNNATDFVLRESAKPQNTSSSTETP